MNSLIKLITICVGLLFVPFTLLAEVNTDLTRSSVVVSAKPEFSLVKLNTFIWAENHAGISAKLQKASFSASKIIDTAIIQSLKKKAYKFETTNKGALLVAYNVSLSSEIDDMALVMKYGMSPGLRGMTEEYENRERGALVVDLIDPKLNNKLVWRGAIEVFTGIETTDEGRQKRLNALLDDLFSSIPNATK